MLEDLMWRILVSVTTQSICIITSKSLSLIMLSVRQERETKVVSSQSANKVSVPSFLCLLEWSEWKCTEYCLRQLTLGRGDSCREFGWRQGYADGVQR